MFDNCSVNASITSSEASVSGFANEYLGGIFRTINVKATLASTNSSAENYYFSGMFNKISTDLDISTDTIDLTIAGNYEKDCYVGGISAYLILKAENLQSKTLAINAQTKSFKVDGLISEANNYIGSIFGKVYARAYLLTSSTINISQLRTDDIEVQSITGLNNYIGGLISYSKTESVTNIKPAEITSKKLEVGTFTISGTITASNGDNNIGGIIGYIANGTITTANINTFTISGTITANNNDNNIGGIIGYFEGGSIATTTIKAFNVNSSGYIGCLCGYRWYIEINSLCFLGSTWTEAYVCAKYKIRNGEYSYYNNSYNDWNVHMVGNNFGKENDPLNPNYVYKID